MSSEGNDHLKDGLVDLTAGSLGSIYFSVINFP